MRLKALLLAVVFSSLFIGIYVPQVKAEGPVVTPYATVAAWNGYMIRSKELYTNTTGEKQTDLDTNIIPEFTLGVMGSMNNVTVNLSACGVPFGGEDVFKYSVFNAYLEYNIEDFSLRIGRAGTPYTALNFNNPGPSVGSSETGFDYFLGFDMFEAFPYQIKVQYKGAFIMAIRNYATKDPVTGNEYANVETTEVMLPKLAAGYSYGNYGTPVMANISGVYQTFKLEAENKKINSYGATCFVTLNFQPVEFIIHAHYAVNGSDMGFAGQGGYLIDGTSVKNTTSYGGHAGISYRINSFKPSAGAAYAIDDNDLYLAKDKKMSYFVSITYMFTPNFSITPTFQVTDLMKGPAYASGGDFTNVKQGKQTNIGIFVQANI